MKTILILVVAVVGLVFLGTWAKNQRTIAEHTDASRTLGEDGRFATIHGHADIRVADGWVPLKGLMDVAELEAGSLEAEQYVVVIRNERGDFDDSMNLALFSELVVQAYLENGELAEVTDVTIGDLPARKHVISSAAKGTSMYLHLYAIEGQRGFFQLVLWTLPSRRETAIPTFDEVAATFRELPPREE